MAGTGKRYTEQQILAILTEASASGAVVIEVLRRHGVTANTYYRWKAKYAGVDGSELKRLKQLEDENRRLRSVVADQTLNIAVLKELLGKD